MRKTVQDKIDSAVFCLYKELELRKFPISPAELILKVRNCGYMSYEEMAKTSGVTIDDVIRACRSGDGCTYYDAVSGRYLVTINTGGRSEARIRWTTAHELGHIAAGHFLEIANKGRIGVSDAEAEGEADYFAASLLAPFVAIRMLYARCPEDVADLFGISQAAASIRWEEYTRRGKSPEALERLFSTRTPKSSGRIYRYHTDRAIDVWSDGLL